MRLALALVLGILAVLAAPARADVFRVFAAAVSNGDPDMVALAQRLIDDPPTTLETIGFYGAGDAPPRERSLRGIIHALKSRGFLLTIEDKYAYRLPDLLLDAGLIRSENDPAATFFTQLAARLGDTGDAEAAYADLRDGFAAHTCAIEAAVRASGKELLGLHLPYGDTLYFWAATPAQTAAWRGRVLYVWPGDGNGSNWFVHFRVDRPDWPTYWAFVTYALRVPDAQADVLPGLEEVCGS